MATIGKPNESQVLPFFKNGVTLQFFSVDLGVAGAALLQTATYTLTNTGAVTNVARSPVVAALEAIQARVSVEVLGAPRTGPSSSQANAAFTIGVAAIGGDYPTDGYANFYGEGNMSMADYLTYLIQEFAADTQGVTMGNVVVSNLTF